MWTHKEQPQKQEEEEEEEKNDRTELALSKQ